VSCEGDKPRGLSVAIGLKLPALSVKVKVWQGSRWDLGVIDVLQRDLDPSASKRPEGKAEKGAAEPNELMRPDSKRMSCCRTPPPRSKAAWT